MSLTSPISSKTAGRNPLYLQVHRIIVDRILSGEFKPGDKLPVESELARQTAVSIGTLRHAVDILVADGVLQRKEGVGTFVQTFQNSGYWNRFQPFEKVDDQPRFDIRRLFKFDRIRANDEVAGALNLKTGVELIHIVRHMVRKTETGEIITAIDELFLPQTFFAKLTEALFLAHFHSNDSLYKFYDRECGVVITSQKCLVTCEILSGHLAQDLGAPEGMSVLRLTRTSLSFGRTPVEYRVYRVLAQEAKLRFDL